MKGLLWQFSKASSYALEFGIATVMLEFLTLAPLMFFTGLL